MRATGQAVVGSYSSSDLRNSLYAAGVFISGDYLEKGGFTLGYNYTEVDGKADNPGDFDTLEENTFYLGGRLHSYPESSGKLTWRLDGYLIEDDADVKGGGGQDGTGDIWADGDIGVLNPIVVSSTTKKPVPTTLAMHTPTTTSTVSTTTRRTSSPPRSVLPSAGRPTGSAARLFHPPERRRRERR